MFVCSNYLLGILIVISYWVDILNARPPTTDATKKPNSSNESRIFLANRTWSADEERKKLLPKIGLTRILFHSSAAPKEPTIGEDYEDSQDIVFPESEEDVTEPVYTLNETPNCADDDTFCEKVDSYPYRQLNDLLRKTELPKVVFGVDEAPDEITNRLGEPEESFICQAIDRTIYPRIGKTKNHKWKYIVNQGDSGYVQGVRIETCRNKDGPCDLIENLLPNGYVTSCKQKYVYRRLLSITDEGKRTVKETFQIPSACCCSYRKNSYFLSSFGNPVTPIFKRKKRGKST